MCKRIRISIPVIVLENAIGRHKGEARQVTQAFKALTATEQQQVITFLKSL